MSIPVNRLKLLAFAFGAAVAGLTGTISAAVDGAVFPDNYDIPLLITIYAMVILGGAGSLSGVVLGAIVINVSFQFLAPENPQSNARILFYVLLLVLVMIWLRPWWRSAAVVAGVIAVGVVSRVIVHAVAPSWADGQVVDGGRLAGAIRHWVVIPSAEHGRFGSWTYVALVVAVLVLTLLRGVWRTVALVPVVYLAAIVWENSFVEQPAVARWILFGALLISLMTVRPQGLLGTPRVEIV
jgi:ABC-type branched-subunit amino acid transport system permease subunit